MDKTLYYLMVGVIILAVLMVFKPIRDFILAIFGAKSVWTLLWSAISVVIVAHWVVLKNFMPRSFVLPTLDDRKTTNAED
jgi:hypothetical protein